MIIPFQNGYICAKCGKWFSDYFGAWGHNGKCKGYVGLGGNIPYIADYVIQNRKEDDRLLRGLIMMGLAFLFAFALFDKPKKVKEEKKKAGEWYEKRKKGRRKRG